MSAHELSGGLRNGSFSAREIAEASLARIDASATNAITYRNDKAALIAADELDRAIDAGEHVGALAGVPIAIKENVDVAGEPTTDGLHVLSDRRATANSPVVTAFESAGTIRVGRSNTPEMSYRWDTNNPLRGRTTNPWSVQRSPGGSSGGAAAAVAEGLCMLAHGNDLGGSVRYPAYCCGVVGIRPSLGRVPTYNPSSPYERPPMIHSMSVQGVLGRTVADTAAGFSAMIAPSIQDPTYVPAPFDMGAFDRPERRVRPPRALVGSGPGACHPDVTTALEAAGLALEAGGYDVTEQDPPHLAEISQAWSNLLFAENLALGDNDLDDVVSDDLKFVIEQLQHVAEHEMCTLAGVIAMEQRRHAIRRVWHTLLDDVDVIVLPTSAELAIAPDGDLESPERFLEINEAQTCLVAMNYLGLPALAVPTGLASTAPDMCPVGVQVVAQRFREDRAFAAGATIERAVGVLELSTAL